MTDTDIIARLRDARQRQDWDAVTALADELEADDSRGIEAIMRAVREKPAPVQAERVPWYLRAILPLGIVLVVVLVVGEALK